MDSKVTVGELRELVGKFVGERDWEKYHNPKDLAIGLSVEAAELLELFLWEQYEPRALEGDMAARAQEELADVAIYCMSFANAQGWDLSDVIESKIRKNEAKYPAERFKGRARAP